jgi:hypothetical protein
VDSISGGKEDLEAKKFEEQEKAEERAIRTRQEEAKRMALQIMEVQQYFAIGF